MTAQLAPYLNFRDTTREVLTHYHQLFGGEVNFSTFAELGASDDPAEADKIMHGQLETPDGMVLMAADVPNSMDHEAPAGISLSLSGDDRQRLLTLWDGLAEGGSIVMPLEDAPWGDTFGMCVDRYGIAWMVNISPVADAS